MGYMISYYQDNQEMLEHYPFYYYWIVIDSFIMFFNLIFNYLSQLMRIEGEIIMNIYTLHFT